MPKFSRRAHSVSAVFYAGLLDDGHFNLPYKMRIQFRSHDQKSTTIAPQYMPEWLALALSYDLLKVDPMSKDNDYLVIKGKDGKDQPVESNSWIICDRLGNLSSMSHDEFDDEFERDVDQ